MIVGLRGKATAIEGVSSTRLVASAPIASGVNASCPSSTVITASNPAASAAAAAGPASRQYRIGSVVKTRIVELLYRRAASFSRAMIMFMICAVPSPISSPITSRNRC